MRHLKNTGYTYFGHMFRAFKIAGILIVHGIFPFFWETKASDMICKHSGHLPS